MINKKTTSTGLILFSLNPMCLNTTTTNNINYYKEDYKSVEMPFNETIVSYKRVDKYVNFKYLSVHTENKFNYADIHFLKLTQDFSKNQKDLDADFIEVLNEMLFSEEYSKPLKKRF